MCQAAGAEQEATQDVLNSFFKNNFLLNLFLVIYCCGYIYTELSINIKICLYTYILYLFNHIQYIIGHKHQSRTFFTNREQEKRVIDQGIISVMIP